MGYYEATNDGGWWSCPHCYGTINALEGAASPWDMDTEKVRNEYRAEALAVLAAAAKVRAQGGTE